MPTTLALPKPPIAPARKSWTVAQFHWLWEQGLFDGRKAFLLAGEIIEMPIPGPVHNKGVGKVDYALKRIFGSSYWVRIQLPLVLGLWTDPVPDIAVVLGAPDDHDRNPSSALLVVEVSDSTLSIDTGDKAFLYAAADIADYWVLDLNNRSLICHRTPQTDPSSTSGYRYCDVSRLNEDAAISPLSLPGISINVSELLPRL